MKRPYSSEGRLALPANLGGVRGKSGATRSLEVADGALAPFGIQGGDRVLLAARSAVEHGDVVAAPDDEGVARLWKAYPERTGLRLARGDVERVVPLDAEVEGVVVAVLRKLGGEEDTPSRS